MNIHASQTYVVNGKTYTSLEEMPAEERAMFESLSNVLADNNQNGLPDIMDGMAGTGNTLMQSNTIVFEGKTYASVNDLPPEGRAAFEKGMGKLADENQNGMPDVLENALKNPQFIATSQTVGSAPRVVVQQSGSSNMGPIVVLSIVAIGLAVIIVLLVGLLVAKGGL